ncbi:MAG TPA: hypothetical protein VEC37_05490 [Bacillota bacterium]|nr:hypothetical protein [Bacillota bacterium]
MKRLLLVTVLLCVLLLPGLKVQATGTENLHWQGFERVLTQAVNNPFYKYGIYSARLIAVRNPEVYLQGDMLFAGFITSHAGYEQAYSEKPASRFFKRFDFSGLKPFQFGLVDFSQYMIGATKGIYGIDRPVYEFLDERITSVQTTLKTKTVTGLECANLIYIRKRIEGSPVQDTYLILNQAKQGFVFCQGKYFDCKGEPVTSGQIKDPVLIFNEQSVWYPLMERDDTAKAPVLKQLVTAIATANRLPVLSETESKLAIRLKNFSLLVTAEQKDLAAIYSIHYTGLRDSTMNLKLMLALPEVTYQKAHHYLNMLVMKVGNYLSPHTAYYADLLQGSNLQAGLKQVETGYLSAVGTPKILRGGEKEISAWGHTWLCGFVENNVDDAMRTRGGHCLSQAINWSAILDTAGVDNVYINYLAKDENYPSHSITLLPQFRQSVDNGRLTAQEFYGKIRANGYIMVDAGIIKDRLLVFGSSAVLLTDSMVVGHQLHRQISETVKEFMDARPINGYAAKLDAGNYKQIKLP